MATKIASILVILMSALCLTEGCSSISGPSDEQVIAAIKKAGTAGDRNYGVKTIDVVIPERGEKLENGNKQISD